VLAKKLNLPIKRGPVRINTPLSAISTGSDEDTIGNKRRLSNEEEEQPQSKRKPSKKEDTTPTFIDKVRQDKEKHLGTSIEVPNTPARSKMSIAEYRAARGLPPTQQGRPITKQNSSGPSSSLFITKKKPVAPVSNKQNNRIHIHLFV
jgi:hypothetical protein